MMLSRKGMAVLAVLGLSAAAGVARASPVITVSGTVNSRGVEIVNGVSLGAYALVSNDPLVADPAAPGPESATPTGDYLAFGGYDFAVSQPSALVFATSLLNPYDTWTTLVVNNYSPSATSPIAFDFLLPSPYTPTVSFNAGGSSLVVNEPLVYDTTNFSTGYDYESNGQGGLNKIGPGGVSLRLSRLSPDVVKYSGGGLFNDPGKSGAFDTISFTGIVSLTKVSGGLLVSDSNSYSIRGYDNTQPSFILTGKNSESGLYTGGIPEPGTYALMILGVGLTGAALRRRSRRSRGSGYRVAG